MADPIDTSTLGPIKIEPGSPARIWLQAYAAERGRYYGFNVEDMLAAYRAGRGNGVAASPFPLDPDRVVDRVATILAQAVFSASAAESGIAIAMPHLPNGEYLETAARIVSIVRAAE